GTPGQTMRWSTAVRYEPSRRISPVCSCRRWAHAAPGFCREGCRTGVTMQSTGRPLSRLAKAGYIASTVAVVAVVVASLSAYAIYRRLDGKVTAAKGRGLMHRAV